MSVSSSILVRLHSDKKNINPIDIYKSFMESKWDNKLDGLTHYLPLDDKEEFDWQDDILSANEIEQIIEKKIQANEIIGFLFVKNINLPYWDSQGVNFLYYHKDHSFTLGLDMNRKVTSEGLTDVNWYFSEIYKITHHVGYNIESIEFSEHV